MARINATVVSEDVFTHLELNLSMAGMQQLLDTLAAEFAANPGVPFHLQILRDGVAAPPGGNLPITKGNEVVVVVHRFPHC